jgi:deoxycytidine triphosphate deaminase
MSLLSGDQIRRRIFDGEEEEILRRSHASPNNVRVAGYDLRIAKDDLSVDGTKYLVGDDYGDELKLAPGRAAFVSTYERFCMPWDIAGNIGVRFHFAKRGLLVFTGLLVDPGFGREMGSEGNWTIREDERLHFFVANIGAEQIGFRLGPEGDRVLSLQFFAVEENSEKRVIQSTRSGEGENVVAALSLLRDIAELGERLDQSSVELKKIINDEAVERKRGVASLTADAETTRSVVETIRSATHQIVIFGVFLVAITLLGVSMTILIELLSGAALEKLVSNVNRLHPKGTAWILIGVATVLVAATLLTRAVGAVVSRFWSSWTQPSGHRRREGG